MIHDKLSLLCAVAGHPPGTVFRVVPAVVRPGRLSCWLRCAEHVVDDSGRGMGMEGLLEGGVTVTAATGTQLCSWCHYRAGGA